MGAPDRIAHVQIPEKASFLLAKKARWKVLWGGRDAVKSWSVVRAALILGTAPHILGFNEPLRCLCTRELFTSVEESIYQLLKDQIVALGLQEFYIPKQSHIVGRPGTPADGVIFSFAGLRHNVEELKSYEGYNLTIVEEAKNVSRKSWDTLENTIRKAGSELWVIFNPDLETDETYQRLVKNPQPDSIVVHFTWRDNPWPSTVLAAGREKMRLERPADYDCIWEGQARTTLADGIYAEEMMAAQREGRITKVPHDPGYAVDTFWDLGFGNHTSIWLGQQVGVQWRMLRFIEDANKHIPHYVKELKKFDEYVWGVDFLPHDGGATHIQGDSVEKQLVALNRNPKVLTNEAIDTGIRAVRAIFPSVYFDAEGCTQGVQCLRHYRWVKNSDGIVTRREPLHDEWSDGADAFRTFAMARRVRRPAQRVGSSGRRVVVTPGRAAPPSDQGWMAG